MQSPLSMGKPATAERLVPTHKGTKAFGTNPCWTGGRADEHTRYDRRAAPPRPPRTAAPDRHTAASSLIRSHLLSIWKGHESQDNVHILMHDIGIAYYRRSRSLFFHIDVTTNNNKQTTKQRENAHFAGRTIIFPSFLNYERPF